MMWDDIVKQSSHLHTTEKHILREELQKTILTALSQNQYFQHVVFQGGTALRLFYGNPRFSEDIDLVLRHKTDTIDFKALSKKISTLALHLYPFLETTTMSTQKHTKELQRYIVQTTGPLSSQHLRIHIEVAMVPAHHAHPRILDFPPLQPAVVVEEPHEILADKIIALGCRTYLKGRDLWDIYFLLHEKHLSIPWDLVEQKCEDYHLSTSEFYTDLLKRKKTITEQGSRILAQELKRFLPTPLYSSYQHHFDNIIKATTQSITKADEQKKRKRGAGRL